MAVQNLRNKFLQTSKQSLIYIFIRNIYYTSLFPVHLHIRVSFSQLFFRLAFAMLNGELVIQFGDFNYITP